jgi:hypothetical protein
MGSLINSWLRAHRLSRAIFVAVALAGILLWGLLNWPAPLVSRHTEQGRVISASEQFAMVELANGKKVRLYFLPPFPQPGDSVPLIRETYRDGTTLYLVDNDTWQTGIHSARTIPETSE